jgi:hypothetical protein
MSGDGSQLLAVHEASRSTPRKQSAQAISLCNLRPALISYPPRCPFATGGISAKAAAGPLFEPIAHLGRDRAEVGSTPSFYAASIAPVRVIDELSADRDEVCLLVLKDRFGFGSSMRAWRSGLLHQ